MRCLVSSSCRRGWKLWVLSPIKFSLGWKPRRATEKISIAFSNVVDISSACYIHGKPISLPNNEDCGPKRTNWTPVRSHECSSVERLVGAMCLPSASPPTANWCGYIPSSAMTSLATKMRSTPCSASSSQNSPRSLPIPAAQQLWACSSAIPVHKLAYQGSKRIIVHVMNSYMCVPNCLCILLDYELTGLEGEHLSVCTCYIKYADKVSSALDSVSIFNKEVTRGKKL